jgi:hypothetical protein
VLGGAQDEAERRQLARPHQRVRAGHLGGVEPREPLGQLPVARQAAGQVVGRQADGMAQQAFTGQHVGDPRRRTAAETEGGGQLVAEQALRPDPGVELGQLGPRPEVACGGLRSRGEQRAIVEESIRQPTGRVGVVGLRRPPGGQPEALPRPLAGQQRRQAREPAGQELGGRSGSCASAAGGRPRPAGRRRLLGVDDLYETPRRQRPVGVDPRDQELEQPTLGETTAGEVLAQAGEVPANDELPAGEHVAHDGAQRPGQEVGDGERVGLGRIGDQSQEGAQVGGRLRAAEVGEVIDGLLEPSPVLGPPELLQVRPHPALGHGGDRVGVERRRHLPDGEATAAPGLPRQFEIQSPVTRGRGGGGQDAVDLDAVVADGEGADSRQGGERPVRSRRADTVGLRRRRTGVEPVVLGLVGGDVRPPELPFHLQELAHAVLGGQQEDVADEGTGLVAQEWEASVVGQL